MGESFGNWAMGSDDELMPLITHANIACGFHAGDPNIMQATIQLAKQHQVAIGAHPSYPDLQGFGRRAMALSTLEIQNLLAYQIGALAALCQTNDTQISYVKPHGALYHKMMQSSQVLQAILAVLSHFAEPLPLVVMAQNNNAQMQAVAAKYQIPLVFEAFVERRYSKHYQLVDRNTKGSVLKTIEAIEQQARQLILQQTVTTDCGEQIALPFDTLCIHSDNPLAVDTAKILKQLLAR